MISLVRIYAICMMYAKWALRNKLFYVYLTVFLPISILVPLYLVASGAGRYYVAIGTIVFTVLMNSLTTASQDLATDKLLRRLAVLLSRPVKPVEYFLGLLLAIAIQVLPATSLVILILLTTGLLKISNYALFIIGILLGLYLFTLLGFAIAITLLSKDYRTIIIASNVLSFILTFFAPVYYPITLLPKPLQYVAIAMPSTHFANIIGIACGTNYGISLNISLAYMLALAAFLTLIVQKKIKLKDLY